MTEQNNKRIAELKAISREIEKGYALGADAQTFTKSTTIPTDDSAYWWLTK